MIFINILFLGDPHLDSQTPVSRKDNYREATIKKLKSLLELSKKENVSHIVFPGDFFDKYNPPISYINEVMETLLLFKEANIVVMSIIGNHDLPYNSMVHFQTTPLRTLFNSGLVKRLSKEVVGNILLQGLDFMEETEDETLEQRVRKLEVEEGKTNILVMHYATDNTVPGDSISRSELSKFDIVLSGHDHTYYPNGVLNYGNGTTLILRPGSFTRRTKEKQNLTRDIVVYKLDTEEGKVYEIKLPGVASAEDIFTSASMMEAGFNHFDNKYNDVFNKDYFESKSINIYNIVDNLPPTVYTMSKEYIVGYLKGLGVDQ